MDELQRTALYGEHVRDGARLVPFAGWEMPVQYRGVIDEVKAVREKCGVFDVSHMGQLDVQGNGATQALNQIVSADWQSVPVGRVAYALLLNENGGIIDDIMGYRLGEDQWRIVANASRADVDQAHLRAYLPAEISLDNRYQNQAMPAVQGEGAEKILQPLVDADLSQMGWRDVRKWSGGLVARGGYTGCDGFEIMCDAQSGTALWRALIESGATPCGLGARDVLRLEAGLPLYGHELRENWTPGESGCGFAAKVEKPQFIGRSALLGKTARNRIRGLEMQSRAIARESYVVEKNGEAIGEVTSGGFSPTIGIGIALASLPAHLEIGDEVDVLIRGASHRARIVKPPFVASERKN